MKKRYIDTGKVRFIFREFPLDPLAAGASMLARCAGKDQFFPLIETLFQQQRKWAVEKPIPPLLAIAKQAGITEQTFNACLSDQKMLDAMQAVQKRATEKFKVNSTPTFFINGKKQVGGHVDRRPRQGHRPASAQKLSFCPRASCTSASRWISRHESGVNTPRDDVAVRRVAGGNRLFAVLPLIHTGFFRLAA